MMLLLLLIIIRLPDHESKAHVIILSGISVVSFECECMRRACQCVTLQAHGVLTILFQDFVPKAPRRYSEDRQLPPQNPSISEEVCTLCMRARARVYGREQDMKAEGLGERDFQRQRNTGASEEDEPI